MPSLIQIKRSATELKPDKLRVGELAYSYADSSLKLFIGVGNADSYQMADSIQVIGGRFYTNLLDVDSAGVSDPGKYLLLGDSRNTDFLKLDSASINVLRTIDNLVVPVGTDSQRPSPFAVGQIRFNVSTTQFEGYDGNAWGSLGGIKDIDQDTFISAETSPNADNDDLRFFTAGTGRLEIDQSGEIVAAAGYSPDSTQSLTTKVYVDNVKAGSPLDGDWTSGAYKFFKDSDRVTDVLDGLNEALNNVRNNTFVRALSFVANPLQGGAGFTTTLTITNDGNPNRYDINWGDGSIDSGVATTTPTHVYTDPLSSPASIAIRAYNTNATGVGNEAHRTNENYVTIFTADPVSDYELFRAPTGGVALTGNDLYVIEGQPLYLDNETTFTQVANKAGLAFVTYNIDWGDGTAAQTTASDSDAGGVIGTRLSHTWGAGTNTGTGRDNVILTLASHTTADPATIPNTSTKQLKVYDPNISAPNGLNTKTISFVGNTGIDPRLPAGFTNRIGGGAITTVGSAVNRTTSTSGTVDTSIISSFAFSANSGVLSAQVNNVADGQVTMDTTSKNGSYTSLNVTDHSDYNLLNAGGTTIPFASTIYHPGLYFGFKARIQKTASAINTGLNSFALNHTTTGSTNIVEFVKDDLTATPTTSAGTLTQNVAGTFRYVSGIPYYNTGSPSLTLSGVQISNWIGKAYRGTAQPVQIRSGTNYENTSQSAIVSNLNYTYAQIDGSTTYLTGGIPQEDTGNGVAYSIGNLTIPITSNSVRTVEDLRIRTLNVNGTGSYTNITATKVQVHTASQSGVNEINTSVNVGGTYSDGGVRIFDFNGATINTPSYNGSTNFYTNSPYTESTDPGVVGTKEATVRLGILKHDVTDYSSGFLPVGPNRSGDTGNQYFTMAFRRTAVANIGINITSATGVVGVFLAAPGTSIDNTSTLNGWLDCSVQFAGSGVPGANIGQGGNGSNGSASTGGDIIQSGVGLSGTYTQTLGTENLTNATGNVCLIRIVLSSGQSVTALSIT